MRIGCTSGFLFSLRQVIQYYVSPRSPRAVLELCSINQLETLSEATNVVCHS